MSVVIRDGWVYGDLPDDTGKLWPVKRYPQAALRGDTVERPNLCLHTTETDGYITTLKYPSQWQCGDGVIGQHIKLFSAGDSVNDHDPLLMQIEMVGRSKLERWLPAEDTLGPTVALTAWLHSRELITTGLKRPSTLADYPVVLDRGPQAVESYYRRQVPVAAGVYGHVDVAGNSHWDPGSFDYPAFFKRVAGAIDVLSGKGDDAMFEDWWAGWSSHEDGAAFSTTWSVARKRGYNDRKRVLADAREQAKNLIAAIPPADLSQVPEHSHSWDGKITVT